KHGSYVAESPRQKNNPYPKPGLGAVTDSGAQRCRDVGGQEAEGLLTARSLSVSVPATRGSSLQDPAS
ncbi:Hypothetical predicted protein, partial [Marmota monax]